MKQSEAIRDANSVYTKRNVD